MGHAASSYTGLRLHPKPRPACVWLSDGSPIPPQGCLHPEAFTGVEEGRLPQLRLCLDPVTAGCAANKMVPRPLKHSSGQQDELAGDQQQGTHPPTHPPCTLDPKTLAPKPLNPQPHLHHKVVPSGGSSAPDSKGDAGDQGGRGQAVPAQDHASALVLQHHHVFGLGKLGAAYEAVHTPVLQHSLHRDCMVEARLHCQAGSRTSQPWQQSWDGMRPCVPDAACMATPGMWPSAHVSSAGGAGCAWQPEAVARQAGHGLPQLDLCRLAVCCLPGLPAAGHHRGSMPCRPWGGPPASGTGASCLHLGVLVEDAGLHLHVLVDRADEGHILGLYQLQHLDLCHRTSM